MGDYYKAIDDKERTFVYYSRALNEKYKHFGINADTLLKVDSAITAGYEQ